MAYHHTHGLDMVITRGANTYGPRQHPEKLIPLFITNALSDLPLPMYGDGMQRRDWLFVDDHADGIAHGARPRRVGCRLQRLGRGRRAPQPGRDGSDPRPPGQGLVARPVRP